MKTKNKQGVSLMVLILTIIVMVILAGTVIISLNNAGVINRAQGAVGEYNLKQVEELANVAWGEAFIADNRTVEDLEEYILEDLIKSGVDLNTYKVEVTTNGVIVRLKTEEEKFFLAWGATNGVWTEYTEGQTPKGDIIAKLYKTGNKVEAYVDYDKDGNELQELVPRLVDEYKLVISGTGAIPEVIGYAWQEGLLEDYAGVGYAGDTYMRGVSELVIEDGITSIPKEAFAAGTNLKNIYLSETLERIEKYAFAVLGGNMEKPIKIPQTVEYIGEFAFIYAPCNFKIYATELEVAELAFVNVDNIYVLNSEIQELLISSNKGTATIHVVSSVEEMDAIQ